MSYRALLTQTALVTPYSGDGARGPVYGEPVSEPCRLEDGNDLVRTATGDEVVSSGRLFLLPGSAVTPESLVTVAGAERVVITVERVYGRASLHHLEARLR
jgi:hypothetical protein